MLGLNQLRVDAHFNKALLIIRIGNKDSFKPFSFFADEKLQAVCLEGMITYACVVLHMSLGANIVMMD